MSATAARPVNGFPPPGSTAIKEAAEYEKILKLRDAILAGSHPRLSIHSPANRKPSPIPGARSPVASGTNISQPIPSTTPQLQLPGLGRGSEEPIPDRPSKFMPQATTLSGIDPVLLTKSDELVRAEIQLLRQRLEKNLRDQFEQKRLDARKRPAPGEAKPDFDVAAVLAKALDRVKPDTGSSSRGDASDSSFDENSLYSSKGPDSTPEAGELEDETSPQHQTSFPRGIDTNGSTEAPATAGHPRMPAPPGQLPMSAMPPPYPRSQYDPMNPGMRDLARASDLPGADHDDDDDEEEEGEYSPPEAMEQVHPSQDHASQPLDPRSRPLRRYSDAEHGGLGSPNEGIVRIVRNHITSPIAPQPSRVSPLAVAKDSIIPQNNRARNGRGGPRGRDDPSPDPPGTNLHPRKRRKLEKNAAKRRRTGGGSPGVKDEPVSPPPFHDVQPLGSGRLRSTAHEPILIDDGPPEVRYVRPPGYYVDSPTRPMSRIAEPVMPLSEPRAISRSTMRPMREDVDLRRVASLHNMRAEQPPRYAEQVYSSPSRVRSGSYAPLDSPTRLEPLRYAPNVPSHYEPDAVHPARVVRTPAPSYREAYQDAEPEVVYVPQAMAPPPPLERIVIDEYGRKYREIVQERPPASARAASTYVDREPDPYEPYHHGRPGSVMVPTTHDERYAEDMPPPRLMRPAGGPGRSARYEPVPAGRAISVAALDRPTRQPIYVDEVADHRPPVRVGSVRPGGREGSIYVDDRPPLRREYMPMDRPPYQVIEQPTRYIDARGREVIMGPEQDGGARYVQRY